MADPGPRAIVCYYNFVNPTFGTTYARQHSRIMNFTIFFDQAVTLTDPPGTLSLFTNQVTYNGDTYPNGVGVIPNGLTAQRAKRTPFDDVDDLTGVTFSWSAGGDFSTDYGSLKDGIYQQDIIPTNIRSLDTNLPAQPASFFIYRLFGNSDYAQSTQLGPNDTRYNLTLDSITATDLMQQAVSDPLNGIYRFLDFNGNGVRNSDDNLQLRQRLAQRVGLGPSYQWRVTTQMVMTPYS